MIRMIVFPNYKQTINNSTNYSSSCEKPKDWEFMKQSGEILDNPPDTWKAYSDTEAGKIDIIKMEYGELMKAATPEEIAHESIHLASACLCLYRKIKGIKI